ncbi:phage baseplate assembly protein V [Serratia bockelmannii]|uniref:phage baseplate assembly protein V n=1 Tax=Serratia bockelmannii TaxID=2703793 RepID=UPI003FA79B1D
MDITAIINRRIEKALSRVRLAFRARLTRITTAGGVQLAQLGGVEGETLQEAEVFQQYGVTSVPPDGAMAIVLPLGGCTSHGVVIATEHSQYRIKGLKPGEVAIYTDEGASIVLKKGKVVEVTCDDYHVECKRFSVTASERADVDTPTLSTSKQLIAQGVITGKGGMSITGGDGVTATSLTVNGIKIESHKHNTPDGMSDGPLNG